jgi:hypothetical protein
MTPGERAEVRRLETDGPYRPPTQPKPISETTQLFTLMAVLVAASTTYLVYNPDAWESFAVGFLIVFISSAPWRRL